MIVDAGSLLHLIAQGRTQAVILTGPVTSSGAIVDVVASSLLAVEAADLSRHPNFLRLTRPTDKKTDELKSAIPVDDVTDFCARLSLSSLGSTKKIGVIVEADALNAHGQNALLKTLEEPKGDTLIVLLTAYPDRLLPTIRSRATLLSVSDSSDVDAELAASVNHFLAASRLDRLLQAVTLTKGDEAASRDSLQNFVSALGQAVHTTFLAKCATLSAVTQRSYLVALACLAAAPVKLQTNANGTLVLEEIALALP